MTRARLAAVATPPLRAWLDTEKNAARVDAVIAGALAYAKPESTMPVKSAPQTPFRTFTPEEFSRAINIEGTILRAEDGTRAVSIGYDRWLLEPVDGSAPVKVKDEDIAGRGLWRREAYAPPYKRLAEVVYLDLDGKGRKVYSAVPLKTEATRYQKESAAWEKSGRTGPAPSSPRVYAIRHKGVEYAVAPDAWYGVTDAVSWHTVGDARATRQAVAAKTADRRILSPGAAAAFDAVVLYHLSSRHSIPLSHLWEDLTTGSHINVFDVLDAQSGYDRAGWAVSFAPAGDDSALLREASYSKRVGERLIAAALRRLEAAGWAERVDTGYVRSDRALSPETVEEHTGYASAAWRAERAGYEADDRLRRRYGYGYSDRPEYAALNDARQAVAREKATAAHPFAQHADIERLQAAVRRLQAASDAVA